MNTTALYQWRFTVYGIAGEVLQTFDIIAPTAKDAEYMLGHNLRYLPHDALKVFRYYDEKLRMNIDHKLELTCLGSVEVKLQTADCQK